MTEFTRSIKSILYDRITSPLYGTLIVSWMIWNWKIPYITFFINGNNLNGNKIDYILANSKNVSLLVWYPLISTLILLTIVPFISNGAYWINLKFNQWKIDKKNDIEKKQLLNSEQSLKIRFEIQNIEERLNKTISSKNEEIKRLEEQVNILQELKITPAIKNDNKIADLLERDIIKKNINKIMSLSSGLDIIENLDKDLASFLIVNNLIGHEKDNRYWFLTDDGKDLVKTYFQTKDK